MTKNKRKREKEKNKFWILIIVIALFFSFLIDKQAVLFIQGMRSPAIDGFFLMLSFEKWKGGLFIFMAVLISLLFLRKKKIKSLLPIVITSGITLTIVYGLKFLISRVRPIDTLNINNSLHILGSSFPSSHSAMIFMIAPFIWKEYPKLKYIWLIYAIFIAFTRIWFGVHYLSDVIAGILIGLLAGTSLMNLKLKK